VDRDGTNDGKCSRVSFGHQAWRTIINHAMIERVRQFSFREGGSTFVSQPGSLLESAEVLCRDISGKARFCSIIHHKEEIQFPVLYDRGIGVARQFGPEFKLDAAFQRLLKEDFGKDLLVRNGENSWTLPLRAPVVISSKRMVESAFAEPDFTVRADPEEVLALLTRLSQH
jgi:hypothetical protein